MAIYQGNKKVGYNIDTTVYSTCPIGTILSYAGSNIPSGYLLCDGSAVSRTDYPYLFDVIGTTYGEGDGSTTFNLPNLQDKFIQGANGNLGTSKDAGLPNITGEFYQDTNAQNTASGAFIYKSGGRLNLANSQTATSGAVVFDASKSNSIYGNSDTVQPPSVCLNYIIKALNVGMDNISNQPIDVSDKFSITGGEGATLTAIYNPIADTIHLSVYGNGSYTKKSINITLPNEYKLSHVPEDNYLGSSGVCSTSNSYVMAVGYAPDTKHIQIDFSSDNVDIVRLAFDCVYKPQKI